MGAHNGAANNAQRGSLGLLANGRGGALELHRLGEKKNVALQFKKKTSTIKKNEDKKKNNLNNFP